MFWSSWCQRCWKVYYFQSKFIFPLFVIAFSKKNEIIMQMLTGDLSVTSGNAFVGGHSILSNLKEAQQNLGKYRIKCLPF